MKCVLASPKISSKQFKQFNMNIVRYLCLGCTELPLESLAVRAVVAPVAIPQLQEALVTPMVHRQVCPSWAQQGVLLDP
jgi:hypothetical protein